jgi:hypothetical protein
VRQDPQVDAEPESPNRDDSLPDRFAGFNRRTKVELALIACLASLVLGTVVSALIR